MDRFSILLANAITGITFIAFWLASPAIPEADVQTMTRLRELAETWETVCHRDARGEHDPRFAEDANLIAETIAKRDALRDQLTMNDEVRSTLARRIGTQDEWLANGPWTCSH